MRDADVLILGAGPAGATAALNLAPSRRVVLVERRVEPPQRIGESLPPVARRLFADMGLLESFLAEPHEPCHANRFVWGSNEVRETDFLRDPDGHGWHLDRVRFERWMRDIARDRGAELIAPATIEHIERDGDRWRVHLGADVVRVRAVVDAAGRAAPLARKLGAQLHADDKLVCEWIQGRDTGVLPRGITYVEAVRDGWWYTAALPNARRVLAFHTDSDLPVAPAPPALANAVLVEQQASARRIAANSATLEPCAGDGWLATGDAALAFDPLSSQGLLNALFTGLAAAEALDRHLDGDAEALSGYAKTIAGIRDAYRKHLATWYAAETRWIDAPFWARRRTL